MNGRVAAGGESAMERRPRHAPSVVTYVVERAGEMNARIVRIQDPAGKARYFTFDHGWLSVAKISEPTEPDQYEQSEGE